jgi:hypothetical protein
MPGPPHTSTSSPACTKDPAAVAEETTLFEASIPIAAKKLSWSAIVLKELLVQKTISCPAARQDFKASTLPGNG